MHKHINIGICQNSKQSSETIGNYPSFSLFPKCLKNILQLYNDNTNKYNKLGWEQEEDEWSEVISNLDSDYD